MFYSYTKTNTESLFGYTRNPLVAEIFYDSLSGTAGEWTETKIDEKHPLFADFEKMSGAAFDDDTTVENMNQWVSEQAA